jgi:hypothetical protein
VTARGACFNRRATQYQERTNNLPAVMTRRLLTALPLTMAAFAALPSMSVADHAWYVNGRPIHWASTVNPAPIDLGDNLNDPVWDSLRYVPAFYWSIGTLPSGGLGLSPVLRVNTRAGGLASNEVEMYDGYYGRTGWVGQAVLSSIDSEGHIGNASVQLNRSYSLSEREKHAAINHEVGHTLGLDHENGTVMCAVLCGIDNPVQHDYDVLTYVNWHIDSYNTTTGDVDAPAPVGETTARRSGPKGVVFVTRLRDRAVRVVFRDYVSETAARAAIR